jgi:phage terminase Nu1 subunit (DNA packaging protein)
MSKCPKASDIELLQISGPQLAQLSGLTVRQLGRLVGAGVIRKAQRGRYALTEVVPALVDYYRQGKEGSGDIAEEKLKKTVAERREIEQRTAIRARELIPVDQVRTCFDTAMVIVGSQLDGLGGRLAGDVAAESDPAVCKGIIFNETRRIRAASAAELEALTNPNGRREAPETAEGDDGE